MAPELECVECGRTSDVDASGWIALRCDDPDLSEPPEIAFYCPICTLDEFGIELRRRR